MGRRVLTSNGALSDRSHAHGHTVMMQTPLMITPAHGCVGGPVVVVVVVDVVVLAVVVVVSAVVVVVVGLPGCVVVVVVVVVVEAVVVVVPAVVVDVGVVGGLPPRLDGTQRVSTGAKKRWGHSATRTRKHSRLSVAPPAVGAPAGTHNCAGSSTWTDR